ncbi:MAG: competence/damage-inducible protein A [Oscillospiraceae bacterium]|nr:competence/damage-inducible protein A [Oscillospiraceae bacterium]
MTAEIISVGTELLLGNVANTDARDISERLSELGINVYYHTVVGDNPERLTKAVEIAKDRADVIITTGGLGPTCDDLTKQVLAQAFGLRLYFDEKIAEVIRGYFEKSLHAVKMTENNLQQAYLPEGCTVFNNDWGTAPGCAFKAAGKHVLMLPGPPRECNAMFNACAEPYLRALSDDMIASHSIRVFGRGESSVEQKLRDIMNELTNPTLAPYAKEGEVLLRVTAKAKTAKEAEAMMEPVVNKVKAIIGDFVYGVDVGSLEETVFSLMCEKGLKLAVAESCTGGLFSKRVTDIPGASSMFLGGMTVYSTESKTKLPGVERALIEKEGAVSRAVAVAMAAGIREFLGADIGIGITGFAGPGGGNGLGAGSVFTALCDSGGSFVRELHLGSGRNRVRTMAVNHGLDMLRRRLTGLSTDFRPDM